MTAHWKSAAREFFDSRAERISRRPSREELCFASGRDPRIWAEPGTYTEMVDSIIDALGGGSASRVLEVGCAAGYIAQGLAPRLASYVGVDVSREAVAKAALLPLPNAQFKAADGGDLPIADGSFDGAFCYDVLTNFPDFAPVALLAAEMIRVIRPGGKVLLGSIPDADQEAQFVEAVRRVQESLTRERGLPAMPRPAKGGWRNWFGRKTERSPSADRGGICCYYFRKESFVELGEQLKVETTIVPVHALNPYAEYRFSVVYEKAAAR